MLLSEFDGRFYQTFIDAEFYALGKLETLQKQFLSYIDTPIYIERLMNNKNISCVICTEDMAHQLMEKGIKIGIAITQIKPSVAFVQLHNWLIHNTSSYSNVNKKTTIGEDCNISETAHIAGKGVVVGNRVLIEENVIIRENTVIGDDTIIRTGAVIGCSNINIVNDEAGKIFRYESTGGITIGNHVEIGNGAMIGKGIFPYEDTVLGDYSTLDAQTILAHNSKLGKCVTVLAQAQVCGNCIIDDNVTIAPAAIISNRKHIKENAKVSIGSVVATNVNKGKKVTGNFAIEHEKFMSLYEKTLRGK